MNVRSYLRSARLRYLMFSPACGGLAYFTDQGFFDIDYGAGAAFGLMLMNFSYAFVVYSEIGSKIGKFVAPIVLVVGSLLLSRWLYPYLPDLKYVVLSASALIVAVIFDAFIWFRRDKFFD